MMADQRFRDKPAEDLLQAQQRTQLLHDDILCQIFFSLAELIWD